MNNVTTESGRCVRCGSLTEQYAFVSEHEGYYICESCYEDWICDVVKYNDISDLINLPDEEENL